MKTFYRDKVVLITGAAGTIGTELVKQLIQLEPAEIRLFDNNESALFFLGNQYRPTGRVTAYLGDIRDEQKLINTTRGVDLIFHTAAFKHVGLSEYNPFEAVQTNINGVKNVVQAALFNDIKRVIFTSSDKAVNPTNVMGTSKLMGERIMTAANIANPTENQIFSSVRFGNVLGSRGSVVPIFAGQILRGEAVTLTDANMTRFVMTVQEAANLVMQAAMMACGGEVFITKMLVMRIVDLAQAMIELLCNYSGADPSGVVTEYIGALPGEKIYEELMSQEEVGRTKELTTMFAVLPAFRSFYQRVDYHYDDFVTETGTLRPYISSLHPHMTVEGIKTYLKDYGILDEFIPSIRAHALPYHDQGILSDVRFPNHLKLVTNL